VARSLYPQVRISPIESILTGFWMGCLVSNRYKFEGTFRVPKYVGSRLRVPSGCGCGCFLKTSPTASTGTHHPNIADDVGQVRFIIYVVAVIRMIAHGICPRCGS
jgi:hypothetical protein